MGRLLMLALVGAVGLAGYWTYANSGIGLSRESSDVPTATARIMNLRDKVVEQGELESQSTINGKCEIDHHENKIIFLAPEGQLVKKGQVVAKFDSSQFEEYVAERQTRVNDAKSEVDQAEQALVVQKDENETSIRAAKQQMEFAKLDLDKYIKGDYEVKKSDLKFGISEAQMKLDTDRRDLENMRVLVKRGFREYEQLRAAEQTLTSSEIRLKRDQQKLDTLENFEHVKSLAEFNGKNKEAIHKHDVARTTADAKLKQAEDKLKSAQSELRQQKKRLEHYQKDLDRHTMVAPQDGTLAYASDDWRGNGEKLHEGSVIYQNQPVFVLPDMNRMQVKVGIHESLVSKVKPKQKAIIRVDAFSSVALRGTVESVSPLSASTRWEPSNNYHVIVTIDKFPDGLKLKPGMNAEVEILVGQYPDVLAVPIQAITSFGRKKFVFVETDQRDFEPHEVEVGNSTISFVEVKSGLEENDVVALDAYQRGITEFSDQEPEEDQDDQLEADMLLEMESDVGLTSDESEESDLPPRPQIEEPESDLPPKPATDSDGAAEVESSDSPGGTPLGASAPQILAVPN